MDIYQTIRALCSKKGISVRELEGKMGFSSGSISKWPQHTPAYEKVVKVANFFQVSPSVLRDEIVGEYPEATDRPLPPVIADLVDAADGCPEEDVKLAAAQLRRLKRYHELLSEKGDADV